MCCSLYSPESANVDIRYANERGITVTGIRDYGDEGVVEYVVSELVRCLHGFGQESWEEMPREITGLKVGVIGLGKSGGMIADALKFFGGAHLLSHPHVRCMQVSTGRTRQAFDRLSEKVLANIEAYNR